MYDPLLGSGTALIAAEHLGRRCYALEIDPRYARLAEFDPGSSLLELAIPFSL